MSRIKRDPLKLYSESEIRDLSSKYAYGYDTWIKFGLGCFGSLFLGIISSSAIWFGVLVSGVIVFYGHQQRVNKKRNELLHENKNIRAKIDKEASDAEKKREELKSSKKKRQSVWDELVQQKSTQSFEKDKLDIQSYAQLMHNIALNEENNNLIKCGLFGIADLNKNAIQEFEKFRVIAFPHHWSEDKIEQLFYRWFNINTEESYEAQLINLVRNCTTAVTDSYKRDGAIYAHEYRGTKDKLGDRVEHTISVSLHEMPPKILFLSLVHDVMELCFLGIPWLMESRKFKMLVVNVPYQVIHPSRPNNEEAVRRWMSLRTILCDAEKSVEQSIGQSHLSIAMNDFVTLISRVPELEGIFIDALSNEIGINSNPKPDSSTFSTNSGLSLGKSGNIIQYVQTEKSLITLAGPGSGKTQCHVLPNLNSFKGAAIVLDVKGECFTNSYKWRQENVGSINIFAPSLADKSKRYNPLSFISQDPDRVWEDSRLLAELLVIPKSQHDPTWENQARQLLTLLLAYVVFKPEEKRHMASVLDLLNDMGLDEAFSVMFSEGAPYPSAMRRTANNFQKMKAEAEKQFRGVVSGALQHMAIWEGPVVERLTATSDWSPLDFRGSNPPTLYLIVKPNEIETYAPLLRVIIAQHVRMLMQDEPDQNASPILFMLDELPRLGKMEPIREALEVGRSYKLQLWMFAQFAGQLYEAYGKEIAEGMIESCGIRMYMNPGAETAEKLSKILGTRENMLTGKTEPVVTPQALTGPEWKDDILVFATGEKPLRLKKSFFFEHTDEPNPESNDPLSQKDIEDRELAARSRL